MSVTQVYKTVELLTVSTFVAGVIMAGPILYVFGVIGA